MASIPIDAGLIPAPSERSLTPYEQARTREQPKRRVIVRPNEKTLSNASRRNQQQARVSKPQARDRDTVRNHPGATNFIDLVKLWTHLTAHPVEELATSPNVDPQQNEPMCELAVEELEGDLRLIAEYLCNQFEKVLVARGISGGWEAWLQTELAIYLAMTKGEHWTIAREKMVFDHTKQRIDIWMEPRPEREGGPARGHKSSNNSRRGPANVGIELKVDTKPNPTSNRQWDKQPFRERLQRDVDKCKAGLKMEFAKNDSMKLTKLLCIGITALPEDIEQYRDKSGETAKLTRLCPMPDQRTGSASSGELYMVWYEITCPDNWPHIGNQAFRLPSESPVKLDPPLEELLLENPFELIVID